MLLRHPESDVRPWLKANADRIDAYTLRRIEESYGFIDRLLSMCEGLGAGAAYDVGSGAGYDTFAIGRFFDRVHAIDTNGAAIDEARRIARGAGVSHVTFRRTSAESFRGAPPGDFVYCNLMSHNVPSRRALIHTLRRAMGPHAYLSYSEIAEGYAPMEIHRAIRRADEVELVSRLQQVLRGFAAQPAFRFFLAGTARPLLESSGLRVLAHESDRWNGVVIHERVLCRADGQASDRSQGGDVDYIGLDPAFAEMRVRFLRMVSGRSPGDQSTDRDDAVDSSLEHASNPYSPFLLFFRMADIARLPFRSNCSPVHRLGRVWHGIRRRVGLPVEEPARRADLDWAALEKLDVKFIQAMRRISGLAPGPIDG